MLPRKKQIYILRNMEKQMNTSNLKYFMTYFVTRKIFMCFEYRVTKYLSIVGEENVY